MPQTMARSHGRHRGFALGDLTIAALLAETAALFPALAVVFREQGVRWTWREFARGRCASLPGCVALGLRQATGSASGRRTAPSGWSRSSPPRASALILVNINPAYRLAELEYALSVSGCRAIVTAEQLKTSKYLEMLQARSSASCAQARVDRDPHGRRPHARHAQLRRAAGRRGAGASDARKPAHRLPRRDQHPVHQRHHGQPEGRDADASQRRQQRALRRAGDALHRARRAVHSGAAVPLLRHGAVGAGLRGSRRDDGLPGRGPSIPRATLAAVARGTLHRAARRADDVHRRTRPPRLRAVRPVAGCAPASWPARRARSRP